jgi:hypothetical protein
VGLLSSAPGPVLVPRTRQWRATTPANFAYSQWFDSKVRKSSPNSFYKCGKSFSVNSGISIGTTVYSVFCESAKKSGGIATVPDIQVVCIISVAFIYQGPMCENLGFPRIDFVTPMTAFWNLFVKLAGVEILPLFYP